jgi:NADH-quinone oxidoreductase subunit H
MYLTSIVIKILGLIVPLLLAVAFMVLVERKVMGSMQRRKGPSVVGVFGILQPIADAVKLLVKEHVLPSHANLVVFLVAPILTFLLALLSWSVIPFGEGLVLCDLNIGVLFLFAVSSLGVYGVIMAGWASNSKYAFLGAMRSAAQMVSYEVSIGLILITVLMCVGSLNLTEIVTAQKNVWFVVPLFPLFILFFISCLAETNRAPFDLPEAEAELVAGYNVEYSSMAFALFFLGEYANMILMSSLTALLFLGGWLPPLDIAVLYWVPGGCWLGAKAVAMLFTFVWIRAAFPRYRYDQLMRLGWKVFLPLSLAWVILVAGILVGSTGFHSPDYLSGNYAYLNTRLYTHLLFDCTLLER